jgi:uncharacterized protein
LHKRRLGRTNLKVSQVGFGGTWISQLVPEEASKVVRRAFELGITYFDTAKLDGDSEEKLGTALQGVRDECVIATKTGSRTKRESLEEIKESLKRLKTDRLDIIQLHSIDDEKTLSKATSGDGVLQTCKQAKREGLVDFIGITGHKPRVLIKAIETGEFDTVLVPINIVTRQALEELVPYAKKQDVGIVAMKPFSAKTSKLITCLYNPSLSLLSEEPELKAVLGQDTDSMARTALRFALSQDISTVIPGMKSTHEVEISANTGREYDRLTAEEQQQFFFELQDQCRDCGNCLPCATEIDIPAILRFQTLSETYGLHYWASRLYSGLEPKSDKCNHCGLCEPKCPYNLEIEKKLQETHKNLG